MRTLSVIYLMANSYTLQMETFQNYENVRNSFSSLKYKVQGSLLFVTYTIIQGIIGSEMLIRTGPLNGKCKKKKKKHNNNIKAIKTMKQNTREYIYIYKYGENEIRNK